jgi:hypothetical protein
VLELARAERLLSDEHSSVDGTLIQAGAEELPEGEYAAVRRSGQSPGQLPGGATDQRHLRLDHRSGRRPVQEGEGARGEALLPRARSTANAAYLRSLGADQVIDYQAAPFESEGRGCGPGPGGRRDPGAFL